MTSAPVKAVLRKIPPVVKLKQSLDAAVLRRQFRVEFDRFKAQADRGKKRFDIRWADRFAFLKDRTATTGFDRHYVYHCAWAARLLAKTQPKEHVDISSHHYFVTLVSAFIPIRFYDFRPAKITLSNLTSESADLCGLHFADKSIPSISCMHVVEHVGLGRYGDPIDPDGDLKAMSELQRVLAPGGRLYLVVPVGQPRLMFNAHRIYAYRQILEAVPELELESFALILDEPSDAGLIEGAPESLVDQQRYGCGCFCLTRPTS